MLKQRNTILRRLYQYDPCFWKTMRSNFSSHEDNLIYLCKYLRISESKAKYLQIRHPAIKKLDVDQIKNVVGTLYDLGFNSKVILDQPSLCSILPITLKYRFTVLEECGLNNISTQYLVSYLTLVKRKTIGELKQSGMIPQAFNIENRLASYMSQWPSSLTTLVYGDVEKFTLHSLRIKIIQRYLELMLDLNPDEFIRGIDTYPTIRHRPLQSINETLNILLSEILFPIKKIKSNLYLVHADPENLKNILYNFRSIGGIDIKEILRMYPKLAVIKFSTLLDIRKTLEEYGISKEAQMRCFQIYTLSPATIKERLEEAKTIPEFNTFYGHPRFLKMIYYNKTATKRLMKLYSNNKKCLSLNILSGSSAHYEIFEKAPGDRLGKGKDLVFCISKSLGNSFNITDIRNIIKRHPFWINIPLIQVKYVYEQLSVDFSVNDIYENIPILLYPWNRIRESLKLLEPSEKQNKWLASLPYEQIDLTMLSQSQKLSLILYLLEKNHYFTGNGVWSEEKHKNIVDLTKPPEPNQLVQ
ncbi:transcription termination factor 5, mitochondrial-like [Vanessa atalanta]|uniref:transcription termination factor 5, mitochondrial-like n=1 Tax=Vanessa atalanta TaxID=42275 RepID=UPI001FCCCD31|nr:transcription termination factor 5, mitochondrial-like [Vanessa atalanta]